MIALRTDGMTDEQRDLAESRFALAKEIGERYASLRPDMGDEIRSAAMWGLVRAVQTYRKVSGVPFDVYAVFKVKKACINEIGLPMKRPTNRNFGQLGDGDDFVVDHRAGPESAVIASDIMACVLALLSGRHRDVIEKYYYGGLNDREIGLVHGCHASRVHQVRQDAIAVLRSAGILSFEIPVRPIQLIREDQPA